MQQHRPVRLLYPQTRPEALGPACLRPAAAWKTVQAGRRVLSRRVPLNGRCVSRDAAGDMLNRQLANSTARPISPWTAAREPVAGQCPVERSTGRLGGTYANASPSPPAPSGRKFRAKRRDCHRHKPDTRRVGSAEISGAYAGALPRAGVGRGGISGQPAVADGFFFFSFPNAKVCASAGVTGLTLDKPSLFTEAQGALTSPVP